MTLSSLSKGRKSGVMIPSNSWLGTVSPRFMFR
jgi:hypothetical protein